MLNPLPFSLLYTPCDVQNLKFETTSDLEPLSDIIGQNSALAAIDFATDIKQDGYNLFAMGSSGNGKHSVITAFLEKKKLLPLPLKIGATSTILKTTENLSPLICHQDQQSGSEIKSLN